MTKKKIRLGIYGGTFSPPHKGHIKAAEAFLEAAELDQLLIIPAFLPPHKDTHGLVSADIRLSMCRAAFGELPRTDVSDIEIKKGGKSYTYITLGELSREDIELFLLVGTDMFLTLDEWKNPELIFSLAKIALIRREDESEIEAQIKHKILEYKEKFGAEMLFIPAEPIEISSSELRESLLLGKDASDFLPKGVNDLIVKEDLYLPQFSEEELLSLREKISARLSKDRFMHVLGVERTAAEISEACLPFAKSALRAAALLHDIAKECSDGELFEMLKKDLSLSKEDLSSPKLYHAFAAPIAVKRDFPDFANPKILSALLNHTTGRAGMSIFEEIIFVADYIEDGRKYPECAEARTEFYSQISDGNRERNILALHKSALKQLKNTESHLLKKNAHLNSRMLGTMQYIEEKIKTAEKTRQKENI